MKVFSINNAFIFRILSLWKDKKEELKNFLNQIFFYFCRTE